MFSCLPAGDPDSATPNTTVLEGKVQISQESDVLLYFQWLPGGLLLFCSPVGSKWTIIFGRNIYVIIHKLVGVPVYFSVVRSVF